MRLCKGDRAGLFPGLAPSIAPKPLWASGDLLYLFVLWGLGILWGVVGSGYDLDDATL